jgi:hypothetical protein
MQVWYGSRGEYPVELHSHYGAAGTSFANNSSSTASGDSHNPAWTGEIWIIVLRGETTQ